jgi:hypothetical protein
MEKETVFERDTKGIKFTKGFWSEDNKIKADGTNVLRALREFRNQIKAEVAAWKTEGMGEYPARRAYPKPPKDEDWMPRDADGNNLLPDNSELKSKLQYKVYEDYINEVK